MHSSKKDFDSSFFQSERERLTGSQLIECEQSDRVQAYISLLETYNSFWKYSTCLVIGSEVSLVFLQEFIDVNLLTVWAVQNRPSAPYIMS